MPHLFSHYYSFITIISLKVTSVCLHSVYGNSNTIHTLCIESAKQCLENFAIDHQCKAFLNFPSKRPACWAGVLPSDVEQVIRGDLVYLALMGIIWQSLMERQIQMNRRSYLYMWFKFVRFNFSEICTWDLNCYGPVENFIIWLNAMKLAICIYIVQNANNYTQCKNCNKLWKENKECGEHFICSCSILCIAIWNKLSFYYLHA